MLAQSLSQRRQGLWFALFGFWMNNNTYANFTLGLLV